MLSCRTKYALLFSFSSLFVPSTSQCLGSALANLTAPSGLEPVAAADTPVGEFADFQCNSSAVALVPDADGTGIFKVECGAGDAWVDPATWPACVGCDAPPDQTANGLEATPNTVVAAGATVSYSCSDTAQTTDSGDTITITCSTSGSYSDPGTWPACRARADCSGATIPTPSGDSFLADSTSTVTLEGDEAVYMCSTSGHVVNGQPSFKIACNSAGEVPAPAAWPVCAEPSGTTAAGPVTTTTPPPLPCRCIGDIPVVEAKVILDKFCRDPDIKGNQNTKYNLGMTPPSHARCGTRHPGGSPFEPTLEQHCYCAEPEEQAGVGYFYKLVLSTKPWEWTSDWSTPTNVSHLITATTDMYREMKMDIEKQIDKWMLNRGDVTGYCGSKVFRFLEGDEVPDGVFPETMPTTTSTTTEPPTTTVTAGPTTAAGATTTTTAGVVCSGSLLSDLSVPAHLSTTVTASDTVPAGGKVVYKCAGAANEVLFTDTAANSGTIVDGNKVEVTCSADGSAFEGAPATWPADCRALTEQCTVPEPPAGSNMAALPNDTAPVDVGGTLSFDCATAGDVLQADPSASSYTVTCGAIAADADPFYEVTFPTTGWDTCITPTKRRKRQTPAMYHYIEVELESQFLSNNSVNADTFNTIYNELLDVENLTETVAFYDQTITCGADNCSILEPMMCSNDFFWELSRDYQVFYKNGEYVIPDEAAITADIANVESGLETAYPPFLKAGEIAVLKCRSVEDPLQLPRQDLEDHDDSDGQLTVFCVPGSPIDSVMGQISLRTVPPCKSVCLVPLPEPTTESDLKMIGIHPSVEDVTMTFEEFNATGQPVFADDRLVFQCQTPFWGLNGGVDLVHDSFQCADTGIYSTPQGDDAWPHCAPQQGMIISAVELMLDRFDRRISDRYKLIDYREEDNQREIVALSNFFLNVTVPVMCGLIAVIILCCCCTRASSPICKLCESKV